MLAGAWVLIPRETAKEERSKPRRSIGSSFVWWESDEIGTS